MLQPNTIEPYIGYVLMAGLGVVMLFVALAVRRSLVRNTHDFIIADRKIGLGFGVGSVIAVWTWAMAVMMSSAQAYTWGLSGLFWFTVPNSGSWFPTATRSPTLSVRGSRTARRW